MAAPTPATRPTGITILAILSAIAGVLGLLGGLAVVGLGGVLATVGYGSFYSLIGFGILAISIAYIVFAYGAWLLRPWAWMLGIAAVIANLILQVLWVTQGASVGSVVVSAAISVAILYYLDTPAVRGAFGKPTKSWFGGMMKR